MRTFLLSELVRRDFRGRYAGSLFGLAWSFAHPLWQLALFSFVFAWVLKIPLTGERTEHFALFLFCGLLPWMALHEGVARGATAITDNAMLVKKLSFPSELLPMTVVLTAAVHQLIGLALFVPILALAGDLTPRALPWLLVAIPLQLALTAGLALALSAVNVFVRDTSQVLGIAMQAWFYFTPIVYPQALLPESVRGWLALNPAAALVGLYRQALIGGASPAPAALAGLVAAALGALLLGLAVFRKAKPTFADEI
ncbi:MAG: ABC transporter permease [Thermoanaerobaculia bacterium]|nr:ABC transporter permease [Thermoanaerobaculia bacterium]MCZ7649640.1 ABC transporter permease [Thermoanaerobaculia bacterium]